MNKGLHTLPSSPMQGWVCCWGVAEGMKNDHTVIQN